MANVWLGIYTNDEHDVIVTAYANRQLAEQCELDGLRELYAGMNMTPEYLEEAMEAASAELKEKSFYYDETYEIGVELQDTTIVEEAPAPAILAGTLP